MSKTVSDLKQNVSAILTGIDLEEVLDLYGSFERAVSTFIQKADVLEASGRQPIMLYDRVTDYLAPPTIFGGALIDIRPQGIERNTWDDVQKVPIMRFDQTKCWTPSGYRVAFEDHIGTRIMRIAQNFAQQSITIDSMSDLSGWVLGGNGTNLALDNTVYYHQPASLRFNLPASGTTATLTKTLTTPLNLSSYQGVGVVFFAVYMPQATPITNVVLHLGSSPTDYYAITQTQGFLGAFYVGDFFLMAFDLAGVAPGSGTPNFAAVNYVQLTFNYNGTEVPNVRAGDLFISLPSPHEVLFYSAAVFLPNASTTASAEITADTDKLLFHLAAYNIYVQEAAREIAKNEGGDIGSGLIQGIDLVLEGNEASGKLGLYQSFRGDNPSEEIREVGNWYD